MSSGTAREPKTVGSVNSVGHKQVPGVRQHRVSTQLNDSGLDSAFGRHLSQEEESVRTLIERPHVN